MLRVVFDSNVFVSAALALKTGRAGSVPSRCIQLVLDGRAHLFVSPILLDELLEVLRRPKIGLTRQGAADYSHTIARIATVLPVAGKLDTLQRDPDDNHLLELVAACRAEYLVTGNLKHFEELPRDASGRPVYEGARILRPTDFLSLAE
jgi:putative PIN family toxin of toxin-antitoxin system